MLYTLGIDLGTSSIKAGLLNLDTRRLEGIAASPLDPAPELPSETLWQQTRRTLQAALGQTGERREVAAIGIGSQMHGAVLYDRHGAVLDPISTWQDRTRCSPEILETVQAVVARGSYQDLGTSIAPGFTGALLLWLKAHEPARFNQVARFGLLADYIRGRLLGASDGCTDPTNACGTGLFNIRAHDRWQTGLIADLGLDPGIFPSVRPSYALAGSLSKALADELGLPQIPIVVGGGDNQVGMLGSGLASASSPVLLNIGTAAQISKIIPAYAAIPGMDTRSFFQEQLALVGASLSGGGSYGELRQTLQAELGRPLDFAELEQRAAATPPGADRLVYCTGPSRQFPDRQPGFRGELAHASDPGRRARAIMEAVLMDLGAFYQQIKPYDGSPWLIGSGKGLQRSPLWAQMTADLFGKPLLINRAENVILGAAILAAYGTGHIKTLDASANLDPSQAVQPDPQRSAFYQHEFSSYYLSQIS